MKGHLGKHNLPPVKFVREVPIEIDEKAQSDGAVKAGDRVLVDIFEGERFVDIVGVSKGRGFQGVVKRHHFGGGPKSHGSMFQITGSIGSSAFPSRVFKGMRMSGHMGNARDGNRSEEHTSELQSRPHLVCRLLLEKKKNHKQIIV